MAKVYPNYVVPDFSPEEIQIAIESLSVVKVDFLYSYTIAEHNLDSRARMTFDYRGKNYNAPVNRRVSWVDPGGRKALKLANMLADIIWKDPCKYLPEDIRLEVLLKAVTEPTSNKESKRQRKWFRKYTDSFLRRNGWT